MQLRSMFILFHFPYHPLMCMPKSITQVSDCSNLNEGNWKHNGFLIYGAVAIHSVQTQGKLLARFSGPREDVEWTARGLTYGIPCFFVLSASWCGNGALGNRLCWVGSGIAFFSSTSSTLAKVSMRLCHQKVTVPSMHSEGNLPCSHQWMHLFSQSG